ncbi:MAG: PHP domain-containing protein [Betaproteobacteria bacterium]|nr:PHP domain-containing protein [Betaproteobacteria bacterium]
MNVDLHCHSTMSDGALSPAELVRRAARSGVDVLALTDHDHLGGLDEARAAAGEAGIGFIDGVEISVTWREITVHIVGPGIDPSDHELRIGLESVRGGRVERAQAMAASFQSAGIPASFEGAMRFAGNPVMISRTHFARYLVESGVVEDARAAFRSYLVPGKPGYSHFDWTTLANAVGWIGSAGGIAVIAHPGRYSLSAAALADLIAEFGAAGGTGIEVVTGNHSTDEFRLFGALARRHGLLASRGSDFHAPEEGGVELGGLPALDPRLDPVWRKLEF